MDEISRPDPFSVAAWRANRLSVDPIRCAWWLYALMSAVIGDIALDDEHALDRNSSRYPVLT